MPGSPAKRRSARAAAGGDAGSAAAAADAAADAAATAAASETPVDVVPFKKRARRGKKKAARRKPTTFTTKKKKPPQLAAAGGADGAATGDDAAGAAAGDGDDDDDDDPEELGSLLQDMVAEQRTRGRAKGVAARSFRASRNDEDSDDEAAAAGADGYDPKVGGIVTKDKLALLDAQYTGATKVASADENPHLLKYLDEKMGGKASASPTAPKKSEFDKLYELPDQIKAIRDKAQGDEVGEDKALGGAVAFGTGIAEVELPIEYQLENIERTELAKSAFIKKQNSRKFRKFDHDGMASHGTGGNFGSNFRQHNRDFVKRKREEYRKLEGRGPDPRDANIICHTCGKAGHKSSSCPGSGGGARGRAPGGGGGGGGGEREYRPRVQMASDDIVMKRFWTRMRNMRRM